MNDPLARVSVEHREDVAVVEIRGEIDLSNADELQRLLEDAARGPAALVVDVGAVEYIDSQGVRLLHELSRTLRAAGVGLTVVAPAGSVAGEVLRLTQMTGLVGDRGAVGERPGA